MKEYIEREAAISACYDGYADNRDDCAENIRKLPAADVVASDCYDRLIVENDELRKERPVVRCKECRFCVHDKGFDELWCNGKRRNADWFCADGARMDGDGE